MSKIIQVRDDYVLVGKDDGTIVEVNRRDCDFVPYVGDIVEVFTSGDKTIIMKQNAAPNPYNVPPTTVNVQNSSMPNEQQPNNVYVANNNSRIILIVLAIVLIPILGVLIIGGIAGYSKAMSKYRTNKAIDQATMLITNIRTMFAQQQSYTGLNNSRAVNLALVPEEMIVNLEQEMSDRDNRKLRNVFSGDVVVNNSPIDSYDSGKEGAFRVSFYGISRDACIQIATSDWGAGYTSGLIGLHIWNPGSSTAPSSGDTATDRLYKPTREGNENFAVPGARYFKVPFTVVQAQQACSCGNSNTCAVTWKYF